MKTVKELIKYFNYQPLKRIPLKHDEIKFIQEDAKQKYPCKHGVKNYCGVCEFNL